MANIIANEDRRFGWVAGPTARWVILGMLGLSIVSAAILGFGFLSENAAFHFSEIVYVIVPLAAGLVLMATALRQTGRGRLAWMLIGFSVLAWGIGELIWVFYEYVLKTEVPYPGWADVFYVLGYPIMFAGVLLLPAVRQLRLARLRLTLDALAGTIALSAIMWTAYLSDRVYFDSEASFLEQAVNILYPLGDLILLIAVMLLAVRRTSYRFDRRLLSLAVALIATAVADIIYVLQLETDTYVAGGRLDSLWLVSYGAFILAGWFLLQARRGTEQIDRSTQLWQIAAPYAAVMVLFGVTLLDVARTTSVLQVSSGVVGLLIIGRQAVAIRENRALVEKQRDDLIASISHELRTPLTSVQGYAQFLRERGEDLSSEDHSGIVETIESQARHLGGIVTDLVDVARDRLAGTDLDLVDTAIADLTDRAVAMLPSSLAEFDLDLEVAPGLRMLADQRRMSQVLVNLLTNALRYGGSSIAVTAVSANGSAVIEIHDDGPGVPKRYEETIWERFERGAHRLDAVIPGSGIGLPIARSLVEAHGGTISYRRSKRLGGACF